MILISIQNVLRSPSFLCYKTIPTSHYRSHIGNIWSIDNFVRGVALAHARQRIICRWNNAKTALLFESVRMRHKPNGARHDTTARHNAAFPCVRACST